MKTTRDDFLHALERVQPAISEKEGLEQAGHFLFKDGRVHAFNKKLYASAPCPCPVEGAVHAKLLPALKKAKADEITLSSKDGNLLISFGKKDRNKICIATEPQLQMPIDLVDEPDEWNPLHESFSDALSLVQECASKDREKMYVATCIHVNPKGLEANDARQACRYRLETGVSSPCLIERDVIKHVVASGVDEIGETAGWLHFRGPDIRMACRREVETYPEIGKFFKNDGVEVTLPSTLAEYAELCEEFSKEDKDNNQLMVEIRKDMLRINGKGTVGYATSYLPCVYNGPPIKFALSPALLKGLTEKSNQCFIGERTLVIKGGKWSYVAALGIISESDR